MSKWHSIALIVMGAGLVGLIVGIIILNPFLIVFGVISMVLSIFLPS